MTIDSDDTTREGTDAEVLSSLIAFVAAWSSPEAQGRIAAQVGISIPEGDVRALYTLGRLGGEARPMQLADEIHVTRPTMSKMIARLTDCGLVERAISSDDARGAVIRFSVAGADAYARLVEAGLSMVRAAFDDSTDAHAREFAHLIWRIVEELPGQS